MQKSNDESVKYWVRRPGVKKPPTLPCGAACIRTIRLFHHAGNFGRKIVGALLQAFALLKTHKLDNLDVRAQLFSGVLNILGDRNIRLLDTC